MPGLSIDDAYQQDNEECCHCGVELTDANTSMWSAFVAENETAHQCVLCSEISNRHLSSCKKEGDTFVPTKTWDEIKEELEQEGLTVEILKLMEQKSLQAEN